jgi:colanic acid/amylovoran biosynthesis protein
MSPKGARQASIGLLWHSINSANLGVGALTVSNLALARQVCAKLGITPRFTILGYVDRAPAPYVVGQDIDVLPISGKAMAPGGAYWQAVSRLDCVLDIGAGDSFADIYSRRRFAFLWLTKFAAIVLGTPLQLSPQTIGPFTRQPETWLAAWAMRRADAVIARDPMSLEVARKLAPRARVVEAVDVAFALPYDRSKRRGPDNLRVGLNVSGLLFNGGYSGRNEFGLQLDYAAYNRALIADILARPGYEVHLIRHVNTQDMPQDDDGRVADRLAAEFPGVVNVPTFTSPSEAKSYISGLDFLVAGRMHACIAAYSSGVPVVPVAYSRKFAGLFDGVLGYPHLVPVSGLSTDEAVAFTLDRLERREELRAEIVEGSKRIAARLDLYREELRRLFDRVARPA